MCRISFSSFRLFMFTQVKGVRVECDESSTELERVKRNSLDNSSTDPDSHNITFIFKDRETGLLKKPPT